MKIAVVANTAWYIYNFRRSLMAALHDAGHETVAIAGDDAYGERLRADGLGFRAVPFTGSGVNPLREVATVRALQRALTTEGVDVALTYTPKGNMYTALALGRRPMAMVANVSGLGRAFVRRSWLSVVAAAMYRLTLRRAARVFFQNADDLALFTRLRLVDAERARLLPGSGVDLRRFAAAPPARGDGGVRFLMVARLLWEKGVGEYVEAARLVRARLPHATFALLGPLDASRRRGVPRAALEAWVGEGVVDYLGATDDVRPHLRAADCVVLPSYREGLPRSLLEAAAMARPVITTDTPGCRDCVVDSVTGYLCRPGDAADLARQLLAFAVLPASQREAMGRAARGRVEAEFDERLVIRQYLTAVAEIAGDVRARIDGNCRAAREG